MKGISMLYGVLLSVQVSAQWQGTNPVYFNAGNVGIGTTTPSGQLQITGPTGWDTWNKVFITNGATNYGRTNLILTGRMQDGNDGWNFGSNGRNAIVFSSNISNAWENAGAVGTEQFSIQHEQNSNSLGFLSQTKANAPLLMMTQSGNVGIGTISPQSKLEVHGTTAIGQFTSGTAVIDAFNSYAYFGCNTPTNGLAVGPNGSVGIGTTTPDQKLTVNGTIHATEVLITNSVPGPDYVFEKDYELPSLDQVKSYIDENKHLPEVPSAKEMEKSGINLSEMNMLLLKKVEELTLYMIELKQENSRQLEKMQSEINQLKK